MGAKRHEFLVFKTLIGELGRTRGMLLAYLNIGLTFMANVFFLDKAAYLYIKGIS